VTTQSAKSDLPLRAAAAVVMITVASVAIYFGGWPFRLLVGLGAAVMLIEWCDMHRLRRTWPLAGMSLLFLNLWLIPDLFVGRGAVAYDWRPFSAAIVCAALLGLLSRRRVLTGGYLYVAFPALALLALNAVSYQIVFWVMIVTWATDIFAYFAGRSIGGPKLAPRISPNKTWAGLIGGMIGAELLGAATAYSFGLSSGFFFGGAFMGFIAQAGDLYESWVKRRAGVKDSGTLLPGHGGVLDRVDGLLAVSVATLLLIDIGLWTA
jgi:phosphatidate cytidylyltransferase